MSRTIPVTPLQPGNVIGFAAPAHAVPQERVQRTLKFFEDNGFQVRIVPNASADDQDAVLGKMAGPD
ncbi:hypothetical protein K8I31_20035, partial [bacterium]|nr:hypothetical protein [bacterium]